MKRQQLHPDKKSRAAQIIDTLAEKLPDHILQDFFRDIKPDQVRMLMRQAAEIHAKGTADRKTPQRLQVDSKVPGIEKAWHGKLKGRTLYLYTDGASRGNPGEAGAGIAILDDHGKELVGTGEYLGKCTNNEAEYRALLLGLAKCGEFGKGRILAHLDSELIVKQILGEYRVKHPNLKPLFQEAMQRLADFSYFDVTHIRRAQNSRADQLANQAIDNREK